jgi:hypothetical protein
MLKHCAESGLDATDAKALGFEAFSDDEAQKLNITHKRAGYKIPYCAIDRKPLQMFRYRLFDVKQTGFLKGADDLPKYQQPLGSSVEIYIPHLPDVDWKAISKDSDKSLFIVEGERKAACVTKHVDPCIGIGGVFNFGGPNLLHSLREFDWQGREVYVCYDADATTKPLVMLAEARLMNALTRKGARVRIMRLPRETKGADDFIVANGAATFQELAHVANRCELGEELHELNSLYGFVRETSMVLEYPNEHRHEVRLHAPETFCRALEAHRKVEIDAATGGLPTPLTEKKKTVAAARLWLESSSKTTFDSLTYAPGKPEVTEQGEYNLWRPAAIVPVAGDTAPFDELVSHLIPDSGEREWFLQWCAAPLQRPGLKLNTAVMVWGAQQGTGKSLLGSTIGRLHGSPNYIEIGQQELASTFNGWQAHRTFIMGSELCGERDSRQFADKLKSIITADTVIINRKHQPEYALPNVANYFLTSNHQNALFLDDHARRFMVIHTSRPPLAQSFYSRYCKWLDNEGAASVLHKLLAIDLAGFEPKAAAPKTAALSAMIHAGRSDLAAWCHALKEDPDSVLAINSVSLPWRFATSQELLRLYELTNNASRVNAQQIGNELAAAGFRQAHKNPISVPGRGIRVRLWIVRDELKAANMSPDQIGSEYGRRLIHEQKWGAK